MNTKPVQGKTVIKKVNQKNELICNLPNQEYMQNPLLYSQVCGNFSLMQTNILLQLVLNIQDQICSHIIPGKGLDHNVVPKGDGDLKFVVNLSELGVSSRQYGDVETACNALQNFSVSYRYIDENGDPVRRRGIIFPTIDIKERPVKGNESKMRKSGRIELYMNGKVADRIFNSSNQYVEHLSSIAKICNSPRTPRMYIYLSAWRSTRSEITLSYDAVKEYLGMLEYNKDHSAVLVDGDKCPRYARFHRDVLMPAQEELQKLAYDRKVEFFFTYEPIYHGSKTRGVNPDQLKFTLHPAEEATPIIPAKYQKSWEAFCEDVKISDGHFYDYYVKCVDIAGVYSKHERFGDKRITLDMPSKFVCEQWSANWQSVRPVWSKHFPDHQPAPLIKS